MSKLYEQLSEYNKSNAYPLHMPGHKRQLGAKEQGMFVDWSNEKFSDFLSHLYGIDITEIDGFDNLNAPEEDGVLWQMCEHAKELYGSAKSFPLVNGSTGGLLAAISSVCNLNDEIILARNCHKSVYRAAELLGLQTHYLYPDEIPEYGVFADLHEDELKAQLQQYPNSKCVVVTSPTYEGVLLDIHKIAALVHASNMILIVDAAHGAHLPFVMEDVFSAADLVVQSLHKTLPSLTQTAILHITKTGEKNVNCARVEDFVHLYQSTSPSYVLMGAMDYCFSLCDTWAKDGSFQMYWEKMKAYRRDLNEKLQRIHLLEPEEIRAYDYDIGKLVFVTAGTSITGTELMVRLREEYQLECEMASSDYVVAMTSICDSEDGLERLRQAVLEIDASIELINRVVPTIPEHKKPEKKVLKLALATEIKDEKSSETVGEDSSNKQTQDLKADGDSARKNEGILRPEIVMDLRTAKASAGVWMQLDKLKYQLENNVANQSSLPLDQEYHGYVSGGYVMCYPPGIPILCPGEKITLPILDKIETALQENLSVQGVRDGAILALI